VGVGRVGNLDIVDNPDLLLGTNPVPVYERAYIATPAGLTPTCTSSSRASCPWRWSPG